MSKCLYCYRELSEGEHDFHPSCAMKFFGTPHVPQLNYTLDELDALAAQIIKDQTSLTGVQPKLSLHLKEHEGSQRLTIVGLWGAYICKPQTSLYPMLPEIEDLTMHLAEEAKISVVPHTLMRMSDQSLCYLTKRVDRTPTGEKVAMEDMCQLTERQTEYKYKSSYERIGKAIAQYSAMPKMDTTNFYEIVLFSWLMGNNDMHLKNFSLYAPDEQGYRLVPAYDLLNASIANPKDTEELALTLNGRRKRLTHDDFISAAMTMGVEQTTAEHLIKKYVRLLPKFIKKIDESFLSEELKQKYTALLIQRTKIISQVK